MKYGNKIVNKFNMLIDKLLSDHWYHLRKSPDYSGLFAILPSLTPVIISIITVCDYKYRQNRKKAYCYGSSKPF